MNVKVIYFRFLKEKERLFIVKCGRQGKYKKWRFGVAVDMFGSGFNVRRIAEIICIDRRTVSEMLQKYSELGIEGASYRKRFSSVRKKRTALKTRRIFEILHQSPRNFGINRSNWSQASIAAAFEKIHGQKVSASCVGDLIRKAGYSLKKARNVLHSHDPDYREKVELLLHTLHNLNSDELLFFIDESGPMRVKKYGGRSYTKTGEYKKIPQNQMAKGSVTFSSALSATTNQLSWIYEKTKNTSSMIDLMEVLFNQHYDKKKLYITWDAASWHSSNALIEWLNNFNTQTKRIGGGPLIEFIPLPNGSQFLNIIESVFSTMKKAVIHNSNYASEEEMKSAISLHFKDRNEYFKKNPKRAGKKIWEIDFFKDYENIRSGDYREW